MPTVLRLGPYRLFCFAGDHRERAHVHVRRDRLEAKFWLDPVRLERSRGFTDHELNQVEELVVQYQRTLMDGCMTTLELETEPQVVRVDVSDERLYAHLADGRIVSAPLDWYPRLLHGTAEERARYELSGGGSGIHWPDLDEDISIENLLEGRKSGESERSFRRWLDARRRRPH